MSFTKAIISFLTVACMALSSVHAQCQQGAGYLGAFDATTGSFVGAVGITLGGAGIFSLDKTGNTTNYLSVVTYTNTCGGGGPVFIEIASPVDPAANYVSLVAGVTDCSAAAFSGSAPWAAIAAADGFPHGQYTTPGTTRTTLQGGYHNLNTFCGECMTFALGTAVGRQVLLPQWKDPNSSKPLSTKLAKDVNGLPTDVHANLPVVQDSTFGRLLATPNVQAYSNFYSNAAVQQVYLSVFFR
ncbi:hypothetical protein R3P38DRAFT_3258541 [Favolaschia claudopus]|uniref:Cellobiose dehydrogenase cytochrome domain-containing protein n=1 Tax=Favolaschia claudopus TaxID=2862362 RepID=A0AAW0CVY8_9AGAR